MSDDGAGVGGAARVTAPERIARVITRDILRGVYPPGSRLPTLRTLAAEFGVNPSTMQRVLARLEVLGLVTPRQGSGLRVNDPRSRGEVSLVPDWFAVLVEDHPADAVAMLADVLEMRRLLASRLVERNLDAVREVVAASPWRIEDMLGAAPEEVGAIELAMERAVVEATGSVTALLLHRTIETCASDVPQLLHAAFADVERVVALDVAFAAALWEGGEGLAQRLEDMIAANDLVVLDNFAGLLGVT